MAEIRVCSVDDVKPGSAKRFDVGGHRLAVVRIGDDAWYVLGDQCTHAEASIAEGEIWPEECEIECPKHGSAFSLVTGEPLGVLAITHYARLLSELRPDRVHVLRDGRVVLSGGPELADQLEQTGYEGAGEPEVDVR